MKRRSSNRTLCVLPSSCSILVLLLWLPASAWAQSAARLRGPWFFDRPPEPVLETSEGLREAALLQRGITALRERKAEESVDLLEAFIAEHPSSVWVPSLRANLGRHYGEQGAYTRALQHWESAWEATKGYADGPGKRVADYVLAKWTRKLLGLGRVEELGVLLAEAQGRRLDAGPLQQMLIRTREAYGVLKESPASSYRCGWVVLDELLRRARGKGLELSSLKEFYTEQNLFQSCSMQTLVQIGQDERWPLAGVERPDSVLDLPYPAVMHMKLGHYMLLLGVEGGLVLGDDPLLGLRYYRPEVLNEEASGRFLVRSGQIPDGWRQLSADELLNTVGRCSNLGYGFGIFGDGWETTCDSCPKGECPPGLNNGPTTGSGGGSGGGCLGCGGAGGGMVRWKVTEPNINLWLQDEPISCQPAYGPAVGLQLSFKQRDEIAGLHTDVFGFGAGWNCGWLAFVDAGNMYPTYTNLITAILNMPGGGSVNFDLSSSTVASEYYYNSRLTVTWVGNVVSSFTWDLPDGRQYIFQQLWSGQYFYLTKAVDREGFATHFNYTVDLDWNNDPCGLRLTSLTDHVGSTLYTLGYTSAGNSPYLVSSVTDRFSRTAQIAYSVDGAGNAHLQQIQDTAGLTSSVTYNTDGWPVTLTTPYGQTIFDYQHEGGDEVGQGVAYRRIDVTEPNNGKQVYLFNGGCEYLWSGATWMPAEFDATLVPAANTLPTTTLLDEGAQTLNSFYWDQKQSAGLPTDRTLLTVAQMNKARMRHWLDMSSGAGYVVADLALSLELAPSADDGVTRGQITWYDYPGKTTSCGVGTNIQPSLIARRLPDGSTYYESYVRNSFGLPTSKTTTYGTGNPAPTRTYSYVYDPTGQDLMEVRRPGNELVSSYTYNSRHQKLTETRYADGTTSYTDTWVYSDPQGRLTSFTSAAGQTTTYSYNASSGTFTGYLSGTTESPIARTETFTWLNGYVRMHTDARGLTRTYTRDGLGRLTQVDFPAHDGLAASSMYYSYALQPGEGFNTGGSAINILEETAVTDRLGKVTRYERDRLGRLTKVKDPLNHTTVYTYCGCGGVESVTDGRNKTTTHSYNNAGWKTAVLYADNTSESFGYNALGQMTSRTDSLGTRNHSYNNQGLLTTVTSAYGTERSVGYNIHDQPTTEVDGNGVSVTKTFDRLGRVLTRAVPGQGTEVFVYSARGLTDYTGPDSKVTHYGYDQLSRKTSETTPKNENIGYTYNAGGDLLTLTDGRSKVTTWTYDIEGLVRTKKYSGQTFANIEYSYDLNQRLAWRKFWSDAVNSKQTIYSYDDAGNLLGINYPTSPDVTFTYNAVNKLLTTATVGLGTSTFTYTDAENAAGESGLWASDAVSYGYHATAPGLRTGLTVTQPSGSWAQTYGFDSARRLQTVVAPSGSFAYTYKGPGTVWTNLALPTSPSAAITNAFDIGGRLTTTRLKNNAGTILNKHDYLYNGGGQRQRNTLTDGSYTTYSYDNDAQLSSSLGYTSGGTPVTSQQLGFGYDAGWNMTSRSVNGSPATYTVNDRNQLTMMTGPDYFTNDVNGNLTYWGSQSGWQRNLSYDDENRLVGVTVPGYYIGSYQYDGLSRLRVRSEQRWNGSSWVTSTIRYLYDGMRIVQERDGSNVPQVTYTRGKDLSGTLEGAGGIGGLLARSHGYAGGNWSTHNFYHADALGNVTYLVSSAQAMVANYKYDPYGRTISSGGTLASANVYRFSSKLAMDVSAMTLYYYGYRFYEAGLQRWVNRDPLQEFGGFNLYSFAANKPSGEVDMDGLSVFGGLPPGGVSGPFRPKPAWPSAAGIALSAVSALLDLGDCSEGCPPRSEAECEGCCQKIYALKTGLNVAAAGVGCIGSGGVLCLGNLGVGILAQFSINKARDECIAKCQEKARTSGNMLSKPRIR